MIQMETLWQLKEMQNYCTVIYGFSLCVSHCKNSSKKEYAVPPVIL